MYLGLENCNGIILSAICRDFLHAETKINQSPRTDPKYNIYNQNVSKIELSDLGACSTTANFLLHFELKADSF